MDNMIEKDYQFWNNLIGWTLFSIALLTFGVTVEPTASYWDCAESVSYTHLTLPTKRIV